MKVFVRHFDKNAKTYGKTKPELIASLPPFEDKHNAEMLRVSCDSISANENSGHHSDDESGDEIDDEGEVEHQDDDHDILVQGAEEDSLDRAISCMSALAPRIPQSSKTGVAKKPRARVNKRKRRDSRDGDDDGEQPWVVDPIGTQAVGQTFDLSFVTEEEGDKGVIAMVTECVLYECVDSGKKFNLLEFEYNNASGSTDTDTSTVKEVYEAISASKSEI